MQSKRITDYRVLLSGAISKKNVDLIVSSVDAYPEDFEVIYQLTSDSEIKVAWRAMWACEKLAEIRPSLFAGREQELIGRLLACHHDGVKRLLLSILYTLPVPRPLPVALLDYCFERMFAPNESVGVQALSIKLAYKLCLVEPELLPELKLYLENADLECYSLGVRTPARKILQKLS